MKLVFGFGCCFREEDEETSNPDLTQNQPGNIQTNLESSPPITPKQLNLRHLDSQSPKEIEGKGHQVVHKYLQVAMYGNKSD